MFIDKPDPFRTELARFVYYRTYSRWRDDLKRRENWAETMDRATDFLFKRVDGLLTLEEQFEITSAMYTLDVLASMRLVWAAGPAAAQNNVAIFNCSYAAVRDLRVFDEALYILMSGTGFGFSVEEEYVSQLPRVQKIKKNFVTLKHVVDDSKEGWAIALRTGIETWFAGGDIEFDLSGLRPAGARLHTMGGRSSGPEPLRRLLAFVREKIRARAGRRLRSIDCHDIMCMIGEVVVAGGVRRSSLISLSDLADYDMRMAKFGAFYNTHPHRSMANNSVAYNDKPNAPEFMEEFLSLVKSGSGERGIFNRQSILSTSPRRKKFSDWGTNPCGEINLRDQEFCNLTSVVARPEDDFEALKRKVRIATIIGTIQSMFTDFPYLRPEWKQNCDEERLLGVSITGQMDNPLIRGLVTALNGGSDPEGEKMLRELKQVAIDTNREYAERFGITPSVAITTGKPDGTGSQVVTSASGAHAWWSNFGIRRVRISATDPLFQFAAISGVPAFPEVGQDPKNASTWVLEFPFKAPEGAVTRHDVTAIQQLQHWLKMKTNWCEHNQSITIYVKEHEWPSVLAWVYEHWDKVGGLSFLPSDDNVYQLAPFEEITEEEYNARVAVFPVLDYSLLSTLEDDDNTTGARDFACVSGQCEK